MAHTSAFQSEDPCTASMVQNCPSPHLKVYNKFKIVTYFRKNQDYATIEFLIVFETYRLCSGNFPNTVSPPQWFQSRNMPQQ